MRELSKIEMTEISGAGYLSDLLGSVAKDVTQAANIAVSSIGKSFVEIGKIFTDSVFNVVKGFWEGRYTK